LNTAAYCVYLPLIEENNPGIYLWYDAIEIFACDCDGNGFVDFHDFACLADSWWEIDCGACEWIDSDSDGDVDFDDLMIHSWHWLQKWESIE